MLEWRLKKAAADVRQPRCFNSLPVARRKPDSFEDRWLEASECRDEAGPRQGNRPGRRQPILGAGKEAAVADELAKYVQPGELAKVAATSEQRLATRVRVEDSSHDAGHAERAEPRCGLQRESSEELRDHAGQAVAVLSPQIANCQG